MTATDHERSRAGRGHRPGRQDTRRQRPRHVLDHARRAACRPPRPITLIDPSDLPVTFGCEVRDFDVDRVRRRRRKRGGIDRVDAARRRRGRRRARRRRRARCRPGALRGGHRHRRRWPHHARRADQRAYVEKGASRVSPFLVPMMMANATAGTVAMQLRLDRARTSASRPRARRARNAIGEAARLIRDGDADVVIDGRLPSRCITPTAMAAFARMTALSGAQRRSRSTRRVRSTPTATAS